MPSPRSDPPATAPIGAHLQPQTTDLADGPSDLLKVLHLARADDCYCWSRGAFLTQLRSQDLVLGEDVLNRGSPEQVHPTSAPMPPWMRPQVPLSRPASRFASGDSHVIHSHNESPTKALHSNTAQAGRVCTSKREPPCLSKEACSRRPYPASYSHLWSLQAPRLRRAA